MVQMRFYFYSEAWRLLSKKNVGYDKQGGQYSEAQKQTVRQSFTITAKGVPACSTLTLKVNGNDSGTVKTTRKGYVLVHKLLPDVDVHTITSVTLEDENGATVLSAHL